MISGIVATSMAATITRLRPSTSAIAPANGAEIAIASIVAVMVRLICAGLASNSRASEGSSDCGPYRLKNAQKPGMPTAARRRFWFMEDLGSWKIWAHGKLEFINRPGDALSASGMQKASAGKRSSGTLERLFGRPRCVDRAPFHRAKIVG